MMKTIRGFTILEILVVIVIITLLAAILIPNIFGAKRKAEISATKAEIASIQKMLEQYQTKWGDYPPTVLTGVTDVNSLNQGIETMVACLADITKGGPYLEFEKEREKRFLNYDNDQTSAQVTWRFGESRELFEIVDAWKTPFVYFHSRNYDEPSAFSRYNRSVKDEDGNEEFTATPQKSPLDNTFYYPYKYQIWSVGPDGENQNGATGTDDIPNW